MHPAPSRGRRLGQGARSRETGSAPAGGHDAATAVARERRRTPGTRLPDAPGVRQLERPVLLQRAGIRLRLPAAARAHEITAGATKGGRSVSFPHALPASSPLRNLSPTALEMQTALDNCFQLVSKAALHASTLDDHAGTVLVAAALRPAIAITRQVSFNLIRHYSVQRAFFIIGLALAALARHRSVETQRSSFSVSLSVSLSLIT